MKAKNFITCWNCDGPNQCNKGGHHAVISYHECEYCLLRHQVGHNEAILYKVFDNITIVWISNYFGQVRECYYRGGNTSIKLPNNTPLNITKQKLQTLITFS
jgi:hypothetical protein